MAADPYTKEFRTAVAVLLVDGHDWKSVAADCQLPAETLLTWLCEYVRQFPQLFEHTNYTAAIASEADHEAYMEWEQNLLDSVARADALTGKRKEGGRKRARDKEQGAMRHYEEILFDELKDRPAEYLHDGGLPEILYIDRRTDVPEEHRRELEWIDTFVKRYQRYKMLIDAETDNDSEASDEQVAMRVLKNEHKLPQRLRRDIPWIIDTIKKFRALQLANEGS